MLFKFCRARWNFLIMTYVIGTISLAQESSVQDVSGESTIFDNDQIQGSFTDSLTDITMAINEETADSNTLYTQADKDDCISENTLQRKRDGSRGTVSHSTGRSGACPMLEKAPVSEPTSTSNNEDKNPCPNKKYPQCCEYPPSQALGHYQMMDNLIGVCRHCMRFIQHLCEFEKRAS